MAENLSLNLDTIIKLRHDVKEAWENELIEDAGANFVLAEGEVGICVDKKEAALDDTFTIEADDKVMFKVGDGKTTFKDLPWIYAKASDVADWAKAETKPTYSADEVGAYSKTEIDSILTTKLAEKVTIVEGKGLSEEDFTEAEKTKLAGIETGAQVNVQANWSETNSGSASYIQNKPDFEGLSDDVSKNADDISTINNQLPTFAKLNGGNQFTGEQQFENIKVHNIVQDGENYTTHAEKIYTENDYIILRDKAVAGLSEGSYAGFQATKYDGVSDGRLVFDSTGTARVGDVGDEQPLATREETIPDETLLKWDADNLRLASAGKSLAELEGTINNKIDKVTYTSYVGQVPMATGEGDSSVPAASLLSNNTIIIRDSSGRAQVEGPPVPTGDPEQDESIEYYIANKGYVDNKLKSSLYRHRLELHVWEQGVTDTYYRLEMPLISKRSTSYTTEIFKSEFIQSPQPVIFNLMGERRTVGNTDPVDPAQIYQVINALYVCYNGEQWINLVELERVNDNDPAQNIVRFRPFAPAKVEIGTLYPPKPVY